MNKPMSTFPGGQFRQDNLTLTWQGNPVIRTLAEPLFGRIGGMSRRGHDR